MEDDLEKKREGERKIRVMHTLEQSNTVRLSTSPNHLPPLQCFPFFLASTALRRLDFPPAL